MSGIEEIKSKLQAFKKRYYIRKTLVGILLFLIIGAGLFLLLNGIEHQFWMGTTSRALMFFLSLGILIAILIWLVVIPASMLFQLRKGISDEEAAQEVSRSFPEIQDTLVNTLQLYKLSSKQNDLLSAAIDKKAHSFRGVLFVKAVDFSAGKRYGTVLGILVLCLALVSFINPALFKNSTKRIVNFNQEFSPEAPFSFEVNQLLEAFRGEDFQLLVQTNGSSAPEKVVLISNDGQKINLKKISGTTFQHIFSKIQKSFKFQLEGAGFFSSTYELVVNERPDLIAMTIAVESPAYTGGERKVVSNTGNITVLEGSSVRWEVSTASSDSIRFSMGSKTLEDTRVTENLFQVDQRISKSSSYEIDLYNEFGTDRSEINYNISVIEDEKPIIIAEYFPDTTMFRFVTLAGNLVDDHGFTSLKLHYRKEGQESKSIPLDLAANVKKQSFYANWNVDSLQLLPGERLEFHVSVSDNDGVNGAKTSRTKTFLMEIPDEDEINKIIDKKSTTVENQIDKSKEKAENINERLSEVEEKLKAEQKFDWQEKKQLNDIIKDREKLEKEIQELQNKHEDLQRSSDQFNKRSKQAQEQNEKLQSLLDELLDPKTKELYEQLKELLKQEDASSDQVRQQLENIQKGEKNLEKELDRALELFKRLKMESALEQNLQKIDTLSQEQEQLSEKDIDELSNSELEEKQKEIQESFQEFREKMDEVEQLNQELKKPEALQDFELEERQIARELRQIQDLLEQESEPSSESKEANEKAEQEDAEEGVDKSKDNSDSKNQGTDPQSQERSGEQGEQEQKEQQDDTSAEKGPEQQEPPKTESGESQEKSQSQKSTRQQVQEKQKSASQRMKQLTKQLSSMQSGMQMEMMQANLDQLRDILDNLVKLSFNQEELLTEMRQVSQSDPRFLELSQAQLKLKDDARVIQDSLLSLAKRVAQISSFITREVGGINDNIDGALGHLKDRNRGRALSSQQSAMTSINNLALLLDDTMQQMQMSMSEAMGNGKEGDQKQNGLPDLQQLQEELGRSINELKGSGKQGRKLSEELARLAAEQELIRRQLEQIQEAEEGRPGGGLGGEELQRAINQMEQNEVDLVNKRLTQQLINRQKSIETKLLEAEKADREQEMEEEREAEAPSIFSREIPPQFEEYLKTKQKEIELLKTIPIDLNPFYKKEVNDYFRRISSDN